MSRIDRNYIFIGVGLLIIGVVVALAVTRFAKPPVVHYHAGFQVYINGVLQNYSGDQYMAPLECAANASESSDPREKIHLHNHVGDVAHVHARGVIWGDLFSNLNLAIDPQAAVSAYINGKETPDIAHQPVRPYDSLVLLIGTHGDPGQYLSHAVTKDHILAVEKSKEGCGL